MRKSNYYKYFDFETAQKLILLALKEDIGSGDVTSEYLIPEEKKTRGILVLKEKAVIAGLRIFKMVYDKVDPAIKINFKVQDGDFAEKGIIAEIEGNTRSILKAERLSLNILQRMCGIATYTRELVKKLNNSKIKILDTRKTTPNFRLFEKLAVRIGGGFNHRFGLYDMVLVKDNHIEANGGILNTMKKLKRIKLKTNLKIELEVKNLNELKEVCNFPVKTVDVVMLDNFKISDITKAVDLINGKFKIEISGGINSKNISKYTDIFGINYISLGALTHSVKSIDISIDFLN